MDGASETPRSSDYDMVRVASAHDNAEASIYRSYLEQYGIQVYVQGEHHRSMLGMVGTYIGLNILVPRHQEDEARELLELFEAADDQDGAEFRGPFRDEFEDEEEGDDWRASLDYQRDVKRVRLAALLFPLGGGHFAAGAYLSALVLAAASIAAIVGVATGRSAPWLLGVCALVVVLDFIAAPRAVAAAYRKRRRG
jgi:hypothetical protein